jgi:ABC-2 type transport system ATP-binding protein
MHRTAFSPAMTVEDSLHYWSLLFGRVSNSRINEVLRYVALGNRAQVRVRELSRGQAQRLAIARALLPDPAILLLDEPLAGVDPSATAKLLTLFADLGRSGRCVIVSTHALAEVNEIPGDVLVLKAGCLIGQGQARELLRQAVAPSPVKWRIRGGLEVAERLRQLGYQPLTTPGASDVVEFMVSSHDDGARVNKRLSDDGVLVHEAGPVVDDLTQLYRALAAEEDS